MRPVIDFQHIFHGGDERRAGLGRNDELLFQVRFENVFLSVRPIVLSLTRSTIFSATTLSSSRRKVHRARPFGGSEQVRAISFAAPAPSKMRGLAEGGECLRSSTASKPSSTNCRRVRAMVARPVFSAEAIRLSLQASPAGEASTFNRMRAVVSFCAGCLPPWIKLSNCSRSSALSFTRYFFNPNYGYGVRGFPKDQGFDSIGLRQLSLKPDPGGSPQWRWISQRSTAVLMTSAKCSRTGKRTS